MESRSRAAQENLAKLEKVSAPYSEQIQAAAEFVGIDLGKIASTLGNQSEGSNVYGGRRSVGISHGREEWLLRWLLKKLQSSKDKVPRNSQASWYLFHYLLRAIPSTNTARMLNEKKLMAIIQQALEEAQHITSFDGLDLEVSNQVTTTKPTTDDAPRTSKKRTRSGDLIVYKSPVLAKGLAGLIMAIHAVIKSLVNSTSISLSQEHQIRGRSAAFTTEYTRSVLRATPEVAAKILGNWMSLCRMVIEQDTKLNCRPADLLGPFVDTWDYRMVSGEDLMHFSIHCSESLFALLKVTANSDEWRTCLEQIVARNIIIPSKLDATEKQDSTMLDDLTKVLVLQDVANAPVLFDVAIRSLQPHGERRRKTVDEVWLRRVFTSFKATMALKVSKAQNQAIGDILRSSIQHGVDIGLSQLRDITIECVLLEGSTDWNLLGTMIKLDANVFLIPHEGRDLLQEILSRITNVYFDSIWLETSSQIVSEIVVPLMNEFAKARDLSGFVRHWYTQLVEFERLGKTHMTSQMNTFSVWEDEMLHTELCKLMEPSLTVQQITQILDWLAGEAHENPNAVTVLLDAIAGSITQEGVVDSIGTRLYYIMSVDDARNKLGDRYRWRSWRILTRSFHWMQPSHLNKIAEAWELGEGLFDALSTKSLIQGMIEVSGSVSSLNNLEILRCACAAWTSVEKSHKLEAVARAVILQYLEHLAYGIKSLPQGTKEVEERSIDDKWLQKGSTLCGDSRWYIWACIRCWLEEYPKTLELGIQLEGMLFEDVLKSILWVVSSAVPNHVELLSLWFRVLHNECVLNNTDITSRFINVLISCQTQQENPLFESPSCNQVAIQSLMQLPLEVFTKKDRERIMQSWPVDVLLISPECCSAVLALKIKIMHRPTFYKGMKFKDLEELERLTKKVGYEKMSSKRENFVFLKELVTLTLSHVTSNLDQKQNVIYVQGAVNDLREKLAKFMDEKTSKVEKILPFVSTSQALFMALDSKSNQLNDLDIISKEALESLRKSFQDFLLSYLQQRLQKKLKTDEIGTYKDGSLAIIVIFEAIESTGLQSSRLTPLATDIESYIHKLEDGRPEINDARRIFRNFVAAHIPNDKIEILDKEIDVESHTGRLAMKKNIESLTSTMGNAEKLQLLQNLIDEGLVRLDNLLAVKHVITVCENIGLEASDAETIETPMNLTLAYDLLCSQTLKTTSFRSFCLLSSILETMLKTKRRALTQYSIDRTLSLIAIIASSKAPSLPSHHANAIFTHLCTLLKAILTSHRFRLEGHLHSIIQTLRPLLRCLFTPHAHTPRSVLSAYSPPSWLGTTSSLSSLSTSHFTRLLTLLCDPTPSSVSHHSLSNSNLTSSVLRAKKMTSQHIHVILTTYIKLTLEMKMKPEVREALKPGLWAIWGCMDSTGRELRGAVVDGLDAPGRAVWGQLWREWRVWGK